MPGPLSVRRLTLDDRDAALVVINTAARWYREFLPPAEYHDPEMTPAAWEAEARKMKWFGAFAGETLVGVMGLEYVREVALLRHAYVLPDRQRRGVGSRLREHLEAMIPAGTRVIVGTYAANYKAGRALEKAGYRRAVDSEAVLRAYYSIPEDRLRSSVVFERTAAPRPARSRLGTTRAAPLGHNAAREDGLRRSTEDPHREGAMADTVRRVEYFYIQVPDKPGVCADVLDTLREAGVNLLAFSGFPEGRGRAQIDFIPDNPAVFRQAAKKAGLRLTGPKRAFLIQGEDRIGAVAGIVRKLADAKINIIALDAACAGGGRYGAILWVDSRNFVRAGKVLGAS